MLTMASSSCSAATIHFILLSISLFSVSSLPLPDESTSKPKKIFFLPIKIDAATNMFYTTIGIGTPQHSTNLVIDLGGENLWHDCSNRRYNSSSKRKIVCKSKKCPEGAACVSTGCIGPYKPGCAISDCTITVSNPLAQFSSSYTMVEDTIFLSHTYIPGFLAGCVDLDDGLSGNALQGLPRTSKGIIGFSHSELALPSQLVLSNKLIPKFSLCFPSSNNLKGFGNIFIGAGGGHPQVESKFLQTTPLVVNPVATGAVSIYGAPSIEYFIDVKAIKIDGHVLNLNSSLLSIDKKGNGGTKISTMTPWTELHSSLYKPFVQEFINKAEGRRMKRVAPVPPFDACFDTSTIRNSITGLAVPSIDLVLPGGAQWTIYGANSMTVMTSKNVACLAFVDGGMKPKEMHSIQLEASVVIGGHQLEDNLLVIDMASSKLSFSSSLLLRNATCSHV
ncbi:hypothetical protein AAZX31_06G031800 [Glycine max]|nr:probable aspartic proteinase GIP2 [Glycine max]XP_028234812.1 basic 7S globulin 2-like [Glycine soja]KAG5147370.1 hypothetical protein JHK82_014251 [Glycine max]KAH1244362.1 Basic 7S globulin 2 [Glycine max]RZC05587.1 Basic 7S globulin 2 [Glycine soja]|eukprot:XP_003527698.1 basic 7S globulin 2 [Glycine max]